jgi:hypothetical protein
MNNAAISRERIILAVINVNPELSYPVSFTVDNAGRRTNGLADVKGADLTQGQIIELIGKGVL